MPLIKYNLYLLTDHNRPFERQQPEKQFPIGIDLVFPFSPEDCQLKLEQMGLTR